MLKIIAYQSHDLTEVGRYWCTPYPVNEKGLVELYDKPIGFLACWGTVEKNSYGEPHIVKPNDHSCYFQSADDAFKAGAVALEKHAQKKVNNSPVIVSVI